MKLFILLLNLFLFFGCDLLQPTDNQKPTLTITFPLEGMVLSVKDTILVIATDDSSIERVECNVENYPKLSDNKPPYELAISIIENHNQELTISCIAIDEYNNKSDEQIVQIDVNNDLNPANGKHDGDEVFVTEMFDLNQIVESFTNEFHTWGNEGGLDRIYEIRYRNIKIDTIPNSLENLTQLTYLELTNDSLESIPTSIEYLSLLKTIRFQNNQLNSIPSEITSLKNLEIIDFSDNNISTLPENFSELGCDDCRLKILKLQNNNIDYIDTSPFSHLEILWLANNNIENIDLTCNNSIWHNSFSPLNPVVTLSQNMLCNNPDSYGWCIDDWEIGVQNCE